MTARYNTMNNKNIERLAQNMYAPVNSHYMNSPQFLAYVLSKMVHKMRDVSDLSLFSTYEKNQGVIRRAILSYPEKMVDVLATHANNNFSDDVYDDLVVHMTDQLVENHSLYEALGDYAPTWLKENANDLNISDNELTRAWIITYQSLLDEFYLNMSDNEHVQSMIKTLPDNVVDRAAIAKPLPSDIATLRRKIISHFENLPTKNIDGFLYRTVEMTIESLEERGVLRVNAETYVMSELYINYDSIFDYVWHDLDLNAEMFEEVEGINPDIREKFPHLEPLVRPLRLLNSDPFAYNFDDCYEELEDFYKENFTDIYAGDLSSALKHYGFEPKDIQDIEWYT